MYSWGAAIAALLLVAGAVAARASLARCADTVLEWSDGVLERLGAQRRGDAATAAVLLFPALVLLGMFGIIPLGYAVYISLFNMRQNVYIGAANYVRAWHDPEFWRSLSVTIYYSLGTIPITLFVSFTIALLLFRLGRGRGLFRTLYFLPYVTSVVAAATVWRVLLRPRSGFVNVLFSALGLPVQLWLIEQRGILNLLTGGWIPPTVGPSLGLCCIIAFDIWHASGFAIVIFLAGMSAIPRELEEAAIVDGAGPYQVIRGVILPLLSPTVFFLTIVSAIKSFQAFNSFYALTNTARSVDTQNLVVYVYAQLYENQRYGYGAAVATLLCLAIVVLTLVQWRYAGRRVFYE